MKMCMSVTAHVDRRQSREYDKHFYSKHKSVEMHKMWFISLNRLMRNSLFQVAENDLISVNV